MEKRKKIATSSGGGEEGGKRGSESEEVETKNSEKQITMVSKELEKEKGKRMETERNKEVRTEKSKEAETETIAVVDSAMKEEDTNLTITKGLGPAKPEPRSVLEMLKSAKNEYCFSRWP